MKVKDSSNELLNEIWDWKSTLNDPNISIMDLLTEYIEKFNLDPQEIGETLGKNKNFKQILENELIRDKVIQADLPDDGLNDWT